MTFCHKGTMAMQDVLGVLNGLRRPRLLIQAARAGSEEYRRDAHLQRLLGYGALPRSGAALMALIEIEADENDRRQSGDAGYSLPHHLDILIAMMGEAQLLRASTLRPEGEADPRLVT